MDENKDNSDVQVNFIEEEIKNRPLNRRKMVKRMSLIAVMAAVFGAVACLFFLLLEPVFNRMLYPEEPAVAGVTYPEESAVEEITPEEIRDNEEEKAASEEQDRIRKEVESVLAERQSEGETAAQIYAELSEIADRAAPCLADVSVITSETDWFDDPYETRGTISGLVIAADDNYAQVLVHSKEILNAQRIQIALNGGSSVEGTIRAADSVAGFVVLEADISGLDEEARDQIAPAELGASSTDALVGQMAIAVGRPSATEKGVAYGAISSVGRDLEITDSAFRQITTQMYASRAASGVIINLKGQVLGVIDMEHSRSDMPGTLCAIGVSELKGLIEKLSAGETKAYLGIEYADVPDDVRAAQSIPEGVYVNKVEENSPAMNAGIQKGDIISAAQGEDIFTRAGFNRSLLNMHPGEYMSLHIMRPTGDGYSEMDLTAELR